MMPRVKERYRQEVVPKMVERFGYKNAMAVPRIEKIVVNMGIGDAKAEAGKIEALTEDVATITGQKPVVTKARHAIAQFRIRAGDPVGCKVTLRGARMFEFLDRLMSVAIPRVRDFRGLAPTGFDGRGNYTMGITEQIIFPEIAADKVKFVNGMDITVVIGNSSDEESHELLKLLGMPFREN